MKLNLGCGSNRLKGWENRDAEVDISKKLPWFDNSADFVLCEHCVEHIGYYEALGFFEECRRVLKPGGVVRIAVPSVERIVKFGDDAYFRFTSQWHSRGPNLRGALHAMLFAHGHRTAWTDALLFASLCYAGFEMVESCVPDHSSHDELKNVDGHGKVIGEHMNWIETAICEGTK